MRENVLQHLSCADRAILEVLPTDDEERNGDAPWINELFERRRVLQSTLSDLELQIEQLSA
jgi:hypothetical protein